MTYKHHSLRVIILCFSDVFHFFFSFSLSANFSSQKWSTPEKKLILKLSKWKKTTTRLFVKQMILSTNYHILNVETARYNFARVDNHVDITHESFKQSSIYNRQLLYELHRMRSAKAPTSCNLLCGLACLRCCIILFFRRLPFLYVTAFLANPRVLARYKAPAHYNATRNRS